jgi:vacuolar-type H+-ATPase subunit C/Vma6
MIREIEYFNARLWGMFGSLLPEHIHETLLAASTRDAWTTALRDTSYSSFIGPFIDQHDSRALYRAVDASIASRTHRLTHLVSGKLSKALRACLDEHDLQNLLAIASGIHHQAKPTDILSGTLSGGFLGSEQLEVLAHCGTNQEAADLLASWGYAYHPIYRSSVDHVPDKPLAELRLDLNRGFMKILLADARKCGFPVILRFMRERVDRINLMTALMWRALPSDRDPMEFHIPGGLMVTGETFRKMLAADNLDNVLSRLPHGPFRKSADKAAMRQIDPEMISLFETSLEWEITHRYSRPLALDPLGAELLLAYLLRLRTEGIRLKQTLTRLLFNIPIDVFLEMSGYV